MLVPVILSGGSGTRLWPVSREAYPKPFMKLADGKSLLQKTLARVAQVPGVKNVLTVTNVEYFFAARDEYRLTGLPLEHLFLLEPCARNTAAAIAAAALCAASRFGDDSILLALPSDNLIEQHDKFARAVAGAAALAAKGLLVTFGIKPAYAETGFGYIECGSAIPGSEGYQVKHFVEKPGLATAQDFVKSGRHLWNSGMFCFKAGVLLKELQAHAPEILAATQACWAKSPAKAERIDLDAESFAGVPSSSIDYALMEKSPNVAVVPGDFDWSDVGSWDAISKLTPADENGNRVQGPSVLVDSHDCYIHGDERMIAAVGLDNVVIVDTADALLVSKGDQVQKVKQVAQQLKHANHATHKLHSTVVRPWGTYTVLEEGPGFKIKRIVVKPRASLSLQMHHHRSEHWVVVSGAAKVVNGDREMTIGANESTFIPAGNKHRLENPAMEDLVIIEVQSGGYLGEDDIVRFDDIYGRK